MGLFHDEGTRRWPVSCGSDLILPIPRDYRRGYTCISRRFTEPFRTFVYGTGTSSSRSKLEIFFRPANAGGTCPRATYELRQPCTIVKGEKFTSSSYKVIVWGTIYQYIYICIQLNKKKKGNLSLESSKFTKYNFLFFLIFFSRSTNASRVEDSLYIV